MINVIDGGKIPRTAIDKLVLFPYKKNTRPFDGLMLNVQLIFFENLPLPNNDLLHQSSFFKGHLQEIKACW